MEDDQATEAIAREADWWEVEEERVHCLLCPHDCRIAEGRVGICRVRRNMEGTLRPINYAQVTSAAMDPIEKKPLYHFHPGTMILSLGTFGCNLTCQFCQNYTISQGQPATQTLRPKEVVQSALDARGRGNIGIAYTYNEPIIWYEYVRDTAQLAHQEGLKNVLVTNGLIQQEPLEELLPLIDAMNVDIKAMDDDFYRRLCGIRSGAQARRTVELSIDRCAVEITNLLVTDENDSEEDVRELVEWAAGVSPDLPLHLSRYRPAYKFSAPPTPMERIHRAAEIAREKLNYVYVGNVMVDGGGETVCPQCGEVVVRRHGYSTTSTLTDEATCPKCGSSINVVI
ncbi:MAG: AmmeMemoRadiSam system radical SAM enzyme [Armatimonadota bacterium]|nr:AmmeMemoRadiSam system radical SAM enzyme [Armatimonadota bacterium]